MRTWRKVMKRLGVGVAVIALLLICIFVIALYQLPSMFELRSGFSLARQLAPPPLPDTASGTTSAPPPLPRQTNLVPPPLPPTANTAVPNANPVTDYLLSRFVDGGDTAVRACDNMGNPDISPPRNARELEQQLIALATTNSSNNPFIESAIAPFGSILAREEVGDVVNEIRDARETDDVSLLNRAQFYTAAADAAASIYADRTAIERASQHAYHLYVLARATLIEPAMLTDDAFADFCDNIELNLQDATLSTSSNEDFLLIEQEKGDMLELLAAYGVTPSQVGYNPSMPMTVNFEASLQRVAVTAPWMLQQFGTSVSLTGRPPQAPPQQTAPLATQPTTGDVQAQDSQAPQTQAPAESPAGAR